MTSRRKKRPLTGSSRSIAPPLSTLHVVRRSSPSTSSSGNNNKGDVSSFCALVCQVGLVVAMLGAAVYYTFLSSTHVLLWTAQDYRVAQQQQQQQQRVSTKYRVHYRPQTATPPESSSWLSSSFAINNINNNNSNNNNHNNNSMGPAAGTRNNHPALVVVQAAQQVRQGFTDYYGVAAAPEIYQRGIWSPAGTERGTVRLTHYLRHKKQSTSRRGGVGDDDDDDDGGGGNVFHVLVLGNSAPAGYGNYRHEAYASRIQELMQPVFDSVGITLQVSNWAMNDLTEFPLTWCLNDASWLENQPSVDMMIWDFNGHNHLPVARFEAFLRQVVHIPFLVVRNGFRHDSYFQLLQYYHNKNGLWQDVTVISEAYAVQDFWQDWTRELPYGLTQWDHFGAPGGTPDKLHPHLSVQEHWLIAFLLSMRILPAVEQVEVEMENETPVSTESLFQPTTKLPLPLLLDTGDSWLLNQNMDRRKICFSGFEHVARQADLSPVGNWKKVPPATTVVHSSLPLLSNSTTIAAAVADPSLLLKPKSAQFYHQGWVYDLEAAAKRSKQRTRQSDFLGYTDWKTAFYGEYQSGPLYLHVPFPRYSKPPTLERLVVCQADDPLVLGGCSISKDLQFTVQGQKVPSKSLIDGRIVKTMGDKPLCISLDLPANLVNLTGYAVDLMVEVTNHRIRWNQGPCSIAHVLAELR